MSKLKRAPVVGEKLGRLTVLSVLMPGSQGRCGVVCRCECGAVKEYIWKDVCKGHTRSCGCLVREIVRTKSITHGATVGRNFPSEYRIWAAMHERCGNHNSHAYADYGGRGIAVCDRWSGKDGYANFLADMGPRPSKRHSIDRIDNDGNYEPGNCRWATAREQGQNKRNNRRLTINGETKHLAEWARVSGVLTATIAFRLGIGWDEQRAVFTPTDAREAKATIDGVTKTVGQWAMERGMNKGTIWSRVQSGMDLATAITKPVNHRLARNP